MMMLLRSAPAGPRVGALRRRHCGQSCRRSVVKVHAMAVQLDQLRAARADIEELIRSKSCHPIVLRLGFHDAGTYDPSAGEWPRCAGATGSIRLNPEIANGSNAGLKTAIDLIEPVKQRHQAVSYADLYQMASAVAVELAGGPKLPVRYGRVDVVDAADCAPEGRLPSAGPPFHDGSGGAGAHLRRVFGRMGLTDQDIVALSGAHTLGRARPERSGFGKESTKYTAAGPGTPGGQSWTVDWLTFDNSYFQVVKNPNDPDLLVMPTDAAIFEDEALRPFALRYADDEAAFFVDYATAHVKLSELGVKWDEGGPVPADSL